MADTTLDNFGDAPLGAGAIVSESFSIFFRNFVAVTILALIPTVLGIVISGLINGFGYAVGVDTPTVNGGVVWAAVALDTLIQMVVYSLATALLVQLAYDAKLNRPLTPGKYFAPAVSAALPIAALSLIAGILTSLGMLLLIIPGLWVYAVFSMVSPAIVIEKAGYGAMGRSRELTKGYRWPIVGALILIWLCAGLLSFGAAFVIGLIGAAAGGGMLISVVLMSVSTAFGVGISGISLSLIYARLREIKEGVGVDQIASVFD